jgi:putative ABC transport system permease protein
MRKLLPLAWRNVWRNRRRSLITMSAVVFAILLIGAANAVQQGTYDAMEEHAVRLFTGDLQIRHAGFEEEQALELSLEDGAVDWDAVLGGRSYTRRLTAFGLVSSDSASAGVLLLGLEPDREPQITSFADGVEAGRLLTPGDYDVLLGQTLAQNLGVAVSDTVVVLTQGLYGAMGADVYAVAGLIRTGSVEMDRQLMVLSLEAAQELLVMPGRFTQVIVRTESLRAAQALAPELQAELGEGVEVMSWRALMTELEQMRAMDDIGNGIFYLFLLLLVGFEIFNTATMSVMERVREFGILQAVGMRPGQISVLVGLELVIKVLLALATAGVIVVTLALIFGEVTIPFSQELREAYEGFGVQLEGVTFSTRPSVLVFPFTAVGVIALLALIYPILRVRRFSPVEAFRHV